MRRLNAYLGKQLCAIPAISFRGCASSTFSSEARASPFPVSPEAMTAKEAVSSSPPPLQELRATFQTPLTAHVDGSTNTATLSETQRVVFEDVVRNKRSVLITGVAGSGKSHVLRTILEYLPKGSTFVTGSTGVAALNVRGSTLHSFAGIGLGHGTVDSIVSKAAKSTRARKRWIKCNVLIIDEISLVDDRMVTILDKIARQVRGVDEPFGGIQIVACGDFLQLPPIKGDYCFKSPSWKRANMKTHLLAGNFRHAGDPHFMNILMQLREGQVSKKTLEEISKRSPAHKEFKKPDHSSDIVSIILRPTRSEVDTINRKQFATLAPEVNLEKLLPDQLVETFSCPKQPAAKFVAVDSWHGKKREIDKDRFSGPETVSLKVGAQLMLLRNISQEHHLVNGTTGLVIGFLTANELMEMRMLFNELIESQVAPDAEVGWGTGKRSNATKGLKLPDDDPGLAALVSRMQYLLKKSGLTLDSLMDALFVVSGGGHKFGGGNEMPKVKRLFVNRDEVESWESIVWLVDPADGNADPSGAVLPITSTARYATAAANTRQACAGADDFFPVEDVPMPLVRCVQSGGACVDVLFSPISETLTDADDKRLVTRLQLPLNHAWSITVHKAQGKTIPSLDIDMRRFFSKGQAYTALSRAPSLDSIVIHNLKRTSIMTCREALAFYKDL